MDKFKYPTWGGHDVSLCELKDLIFTCVSGMENGSEEVYLTTLCGRQVKMFHEQDCCEHVYLADVCGDVDDLLLAPVVHFEERCSTGGEDSEDKPSEYSESFTWTFYDIQTTKGCITLRWLGESNGYYSECVSIIEGSPVG